MVRIVVLFMAGAAIGAIGSAWSGYDLGQMSLAWGSGAAFLWIIATYTGAVAARFRPAARRWTYCWILFLGFLAPGALFARPLMIGLQFWTAMGVGAVSSALALAWLYAGNWGRISRWLWAPVWAAASRDVQRQLSAVEEKAEKADTWLLEDQIASVSAGPVGGSCDAIADPLQTLRNTKGSV